MTDGWASGLSLSMSGGFGSDDAHERPGNSRHRRGGRRYPRPVEPDPDRQREDVAMKPAKPMLTPGQKPMAADSMIAFVLLVGGLFVFLPWWKALLAIGLIFGAAFPLVLCERQMVFAYNDGRPHEHWGWIGVGIAVAMIIGIGVIQFHRAGALPWWP